MTILPQTPKRASRNTLEIISAAKLKIWPEVFAAALQAGHSREFRLWAIARAVDHHGSGRIAVADLQETLDKRGVRGGAPGTVRRILQAGDGVFWTVYHNRQGVKILHLRGTASVAAALGLDRLRLPQPATIPWELARKIGQFRAACYAARFARDGDGDEAWSRPISRVALESATGVSTRRQQRWQQALGGRMQSVQNAEPLRLDRGRPVPRILEDEETVHVGAVGRELPPGYFVDRLDVGNYRLYIVFERLPNSYRTDRRSIAPSPRGRTGKINSMLRSRLVQRDNMPRRYYDPQNGPEVRATARAYEAIRGKEHFYTRSAIVPGMVGWRRSVSNGRGDVLRMWTRHDAQSLFR